MPLGIPEPIWVGAALLLMLGIFVWDMVRLARRFDAEMRHKFGEPLPKREFEITPHHPIAPGTDPLRKMTLEEHRRAHRLGRER